MTEKPPAPERDETTSGRLSRKEDLARAKAIRKSKAVESLQARSARPYSEQGRSKGLDASSSPGRPRETAVSATSKPALWLLGSLCVLGLFLAIAVNGNHEESTNRASSLKASDDEPVAAAGQIQPDAIAASVADGAQTTPGAAAGIGTDSVAKETAAGQDATVFEEAMSLDRTNEGFYAMIDATVEKLIAAGAIPAAPLVRSDYTSYYKVVSTDGFLGSSVTIVEHEYFEGYIGCCVNSGLSLILSGPATPEVKAFAEARNCAVKPASQIYLPQEVMDSLGVDELSTADLTEISCKENDEYR